MTARDIEIRNSGAIELIEDDTAFEECVRVAVRMRPLDFNEVTHAPKKVVSVDEKGKRINLSNPKKESEEPRPFSYDFTFGEDSTQENVYKQCGMKIIDSVIEGYNGSIFAYGQTGSGKSFTMMGN